MDKKQSEFWTSREEHIKRHQELYNRMSTPEGYEEVMSEIFVPILRTINPFMTPKEQRLMEYRRFKEECRKNDNIS